MSAECRVDERTSTPALVSRINPPANNINRFDRTARRAIRTDAEDFTKASTEGFVTNSLFWIRRRRLVHQVFWCHVGRQHMSWSTELRFGAERQQVDPLSSGTIQRLRSCRGETRRRPSRRSGACRRLLSPVVAIHRLSEFVINEIKSLEREFSTRDHGGCLHITNRRS